MEITKHILEACRRKDESAYKSIYQAYALFVFAIVKNYFQGQEERKDMLQEIFVQVFASIHRFDANKGSFKAWLSRVTVNQCAMHLRKRSRLHIAFSIDEIEEVSSEDIALLDELDRGQLESLLSAMPEGYRTIFLLNVVDSYTHKEIAQLLDIKEQTSRSQLARAVKWIRKRSGVQSKLLNLIGYGVQ